MNLIKTAILSVVFFTCYASSTVAQVFDDWEARPNISLKYKINKHWTIAGTYYLYMDRNMSHYDKSVVAADISYKISSWMKAGIDYRHGIERDEHYHDIRYALTFDHNSPSKRWKIIYRPMVQQEFSSLRTKHLAERPVKYYLRNRIAVNYDITSRTEIYLFTENYLKPSGGDFFFHRQKSALGADFEINNRNKIGVRFEVINKKNGKTNARPNISYTYTLGSRKK